jgi:hypothetical protein
MLMFGLVWINKATGTTRFFELSFTIEGTTNKGILIVYKSIITLCETIFYNLSFFTMTRYFSKLIV